MVAAGASPSGVARHRPVVLYQGSCPFCRAAARFVARLDRGRRVAFLAFQDEEAHPFMEAIPADEREGSWHLVDSDGRRVSGGRATVQLLLLLPRLSWLGRIIQASRLTWLVGVLYRAVAAQRGKLSRFFSDAPGPKRFP